MKHPLILAWLTASLTVAAHAQETSKSDAARRSVEPTAPAPSATDMAPIIATAVEKLLAMQEGEAGAEWPYEGVYRVGGKIPIGYRIGGTAICAMALVLSPGYSDDHARRDAVSRALGFITSGLDHPQMNPDYSGGYDVRGWGYTYALTFMLRVKSTAAQPAEMAESLDASIQRLISAIERTEIPQVGGWNYARGRGKDAVSPPAPFMTAPTLQALFEARKQGFAVDEAVVNRAVNSLEHARTATGSFRYSGIDGERSRESVPGSVGRMVVAEATLHLAGRSSLANVRGAIDAFLVHWEWLDTRRRQQGTHVPPYGIAPYYFYFAHYYAAQAIELLPEHERGEYRRRLRDLIMKTRDHESGTWNDRVFDRSANFGTAMSTMALLMPQLQRPAGWTMTPARRQNEEPHGMEPRMDADGHGWFTAEHDESRDNEPHDVDGEKFFQGRACGPLGSMHFRIKLSAALRAAMWGGR